MDLWTKVDDRKDSKDESISSGILYKKILISISRQYGKKIVYRWWLRQIKQKYEYNGYFSFLPSRSVYRKTYMQRWIRRCLYKLPTSWQFEFHNSSTLQFEQKKSKVNPIILLTSEKLKTFTRKTFGSWEITTKKNTKRG